MKCRNLLLLKGFHWLFYQLKKWANPGLFFVYYCSFLVTISIQIEKSIDGVLGIRTRGLRMVGADKTTELWQHYSLVYCIVNYLYKYGKNVLQYRSKTNLLQKFFHPWVKACRRPRRISSCPSRRPIRPHRVRR